MAYLNFDAIFEFLTSLDILLQVTNIIFQKGVDNFEIEHKTCVGKGCSTPLTPDGSS